MSEISYWENIWSGRPIGPANNIARRAYKLIKMRNLNTLLDLGCGNGRDSVYFCKKGLKITAVDFSESSINSLRSQNHNLICVCEDLRNLTFAENSFDIIYSHLSLHYFDDQTTSQILNKVYQILRNDGLFFVKCKSIDDVLYGQGEKMGENMYQQGHLRHFFSTDYMAEKLCQFTIMKIRKTSSVYHGYRSSFIEAIATK